MTVKSLIKSLTLPLMRDVNGLAVREMVVNGDMERDSNWAAINEYASVERSAVQAYNGLYSLLIVASFWAGAWSDLWTSVTGKRYIVEAWIFCTSGTSVAVGIRNGEDSAFVAGTGEFTVVQNAWTKVGFEFTELAGGSEAHISFITPIGEETTMYVDNVSVKEVV